MAEVTIAAAQALWAIIKIINIIFMGVLVELHQTTSTSNSTEAMLALEVVEVHMVLRQAFCRTGIVID